MGKNTETPKFFSENVWLKRLGLIILIIGMYPGIVAEYPVYVDYTIKFVIGAIVLSYVLKMIIGFFKSLLT